MQKCLTTAVFVAMLAATLVAAADSRPRDPWVFRCVLDQQPRMVVINPAEGLWLAYDATNCSLAKAWIGSVNFDGAVYTTVHGPQPTSAGAALIGAPLNADLDSWWIADPSGARIDATLRWKGYRFIGGDVALMYELALPDGSRVAVRETPDMEMDEQSAVRVSRTYVTSNVPDGCTLWTTMPTRTPEGLPIAYRSQTSEYTAGQGDPAVTPFRINANGTTTLTAVVKSEQKGSDS